VDDGSTDASGAMCDDYAARDPRVRVIHKENGHQITARKAGLAQAQGDYIGWVDSDDWIEPDMYEKLVRAAVEQQADITICNFITDYSDGERRSRQNYPPGLYDRARLVKEVYPTMLRNERFGSAGLDAVWVTKLFRREVIQKNLPNVDDRVHYYADVACTVPAMLEAERVYFLDNFYPYHYRQTTQQMSRKYKKEFFERTMLLIDYLNQVDDEKHIFDMSPQINGLLRFFAIRAAEVEFAQGSPSSLWQKYRFIRRMCRDPRVQTAFKLPHRTVALPKYRAYTFFIEYRLCRLLFLSLLTAKVKKSLFAGFEKNQPQLFG
jgi:glycosyltransferase involved in cell wall biosynthesis